MELPACLKLSLKMRVGLPAFIRRRLNKGSTESPSYQQLGVRRLLDHVWNRSAFYRDYYSSHGIRERDLPDISVPDLPFLSKQLLMENFDLAVTDPRLKKADIERWLEDYPDPGKKFADHYIVVHTSGSSGRLGIFVYDPKAWRIADTAIASRLLTLGNATPKATRVAFYAASHGHFAMVSIAASLDKSIYDPLILSLLDPRERIVEQLNAFQPERLYGYSSSVCDLADLAIRGALRICPQAIIVAGDKLTPGMERKIRMAWDAAVHVTFGSSESKYIAMRASGQHEMTVFNELNILEVLDGQNRPVSSGNEGRAVLTNLYNYTLPVLRYESGDYVVPGKTDHDLTAITLREIRGRVNDALPVLGHNGVHDSVHPIVLSEFHVTSLEKIQFVSKQPGTIRINYVAPADIGASVRRKFQEILDSKGATRTEFEVQRVSQIENDRATGKFHLVRVEHEQLVTLPV